MAKTPSPFVLDAETLDVAAGLDAAAMGEAYLAQVRATLGLTGRFVDKMPLNVFVAAHILRALPEARLYHDWGGGLIWLDAPAFSAAQAAPLRGVLAVCWRMRPNNVSKKSECAVSPPNMSSKSSGEP